MKSFHVEVKITEGVIADPWSHLSYPDGDGWYHVNGFTYVVSSACVYGGFSHSIPDVSSVPQPKEGEVVLREGFVLDLIRASRSDAYEDDGRDTDMVITLKDTVTPADVPTMSELKKSGIGEW